MNVFRAIEGDVRAAIAEMIAAGQLPADAAEAKIAFDPQREEGRGEIATNAALVLAGKARRKPRELAVALAARLTERPSIAQVEVAGPGFVNVTLRPEAWRAVVPAILAAGLAYGDSAIGAGQPINVEYVSANPTGPMHVGHGRGAVVGDALAALLAKAGFAVTREYYINDGGVQIDALARSLMARYRVALGVDDAQMLERARAEGTLAYGGDYLIAAAEALAARDGDRWLTAAEDEWLPALRAFAVERMMALIRDDLAALGVAFDVFSSEQALVASGGVDAAIAALADRGLIYQGVLEPPKGKLPDDWEAREQTLFRASQFGDEVDRPLQKSDGSWTYFAADIAYHLDKRRRGFPVLIDVWGADHGGYIKRMQAAVEAVTEGRAVLDVKVCQLVNLLDGGQPVKMSKRAGTFIALRDVLDRVGRGVFRFLMLTRKNDAPLDFDFQKVTEQSRDNPVFYVQYAHARAASVLRLAAEEGYPAEVGTPDASDLEALADSAEIDLIRGLAEWPRVVETAAQAHEPHRIAFYLQEVAALFHGLWTKGKDDSRLRFIRGDDPQGTRARLALVRATKVVIASGLAVMGVEPVEELR